MTGGSYQMLMNEALAEFAQERRLADVVRETIMPELQCNMNLCLSRRIYCLMCYFI